MSPYVIVWRPGIRALPLQTISTQTPELECYIRGALELGGGGMVNHAGSGWEDPLATMRYGDCRGDPADIVQSRSYGFVDSKSDTRFVTVLVPVAGRRMSTTHGSQQCCWF